MARRRRPRHAWAMYEPSPLEALLGMPRAALLRALDRPATAGELAARLSLVPSGITHHVDVMEPAGLVTRERRGQYVVVRRTARGARLIELFPR